MGDNRADPGADAREDDRAGSPDVVEPPRPEYLGATMTIAGREGIAWARLADVDPELWAAIRGETDRQRWKIELIASENYTFAAVMEAQGSPLTNKYAEGLPGKRYYGGCEFVDVAERLAQERLKALFGGDHANVQPHSGASANQAVYFACLE